MEKEYYTPQEAAELLSTHKQTILRLINSGDLKAVNIGAGSKPYYRIPKISIQEFLSRNKTYEQPRTSVNPEN